MATHDTLTDLPNRGLFREELEAAFKGLDKGRRPALLVINLDHFKAINDSQGHAAGDGVLRKVAERLSEVVVAKGLAARMGGDEFAVLLPTVAVPQQAADMARAIVKALSEPIVLGEKSLRLSTSIGIALAPGDGRTADALMNNADLALLKAKSEGRGTYHFFEAEMNASLQRRRQIEVGLREALDTNGLSVVFQPIVSLECDRIVAAEALMRWTHPELGPISPVEFIPIAEETGLIHAMGSWIVLAAAQAAAQWPEDVRVAVNLSAMQFKRSDLIAIIKNALAVARIAPDRLELEITESLLLEDSQANLDLLLELRGLGVRVAMDDFGTGYSSLSYLRAFPFDKIKIDRSFMTDVATKPDSRAILGAIIGMGRSLGMATVAEGVETREQLAVVRAEGATQVQGYYFSPPVSGTRLARMIADESFAAKVAC